MAPFWNNQDKSIFYEQKTINLNSQDQKQLDKEKSKKRCIF